MQNLFIAAHLQGKTILDAGAGYGTLTHCLRSLGFDAIGCELNPACIAIAKEWYNLELDLVDIYHTNYPDNRFDVVILREVVFHLDFEKAISELTRIARYQLVIFQGNNTLPRKIGQWIYGHREFNEREPAYYQRVCEEHGWRVAPLVYRDILAFPLSGGFIGRQWVPNLGWLHRALLFTDRIVTSCLCATKLDRYFCFRFLLSATK